MSAAFSTLPVSRRRLWQALANLLFGSALCVGFLAVRWSMAGEVHFRFLIWNLILAWIPLLLVLWLRRTGHGFVKFSFIAATWVLFFPNSFYIVTDFEHSQRFGSDHIPRWFDIIVFSAYACGGLFLGCLSLYLMQLIVRARFGWRLGWCFSGAMLALASVGIYLGRFLRLNSWDVVTRPRYAMHTLAEAFQPPASQELAEFSLTFFCFSLAVYSFAVSLAHLHEGEGVRGPAPLPRLDQPPIPEPIKTLPESSPFGR